MFATGAGKIDLISLKIMFYSFLLNVEKQGKGSERRKSLRRKSKKEHRKCKSLKGSERRKSKLRLSMF